MSKNLHPLQSPLWGEFRKRTGLKVIKEHNLLITIHPIPHTKYFIGYIPRGPKINQQILDQLKAIGQKENCIFMQIEPGVEKDINSNYDLKDLYPSAHPLLTKYNFVLDITKSEEELLKNMHPKTRYNIRLAEKKGVKIIEDNSDQSFEEYLLLTKETTQRQKFYAHTPTYHRLMWETLKNKSTTSKPMTYLLTAHLLKAVYNNETLVTWILFILGDTLYYPYGASSTKYREVMASNLMMWETIKFGKKLGLKKLDMWGALGANPNPKDPWYGFHRFKQGYGPRHVEYVGSYDLVIKKTAYLVFKIMDKIRWFILKFK